MGRARKGALKNCLLQAPWLAGTLLAVEDKGDTFENWRIECAHADRQCWVKRAQRRTVLIGRELGKYGIEIAALSETRFAEIGEIKEVGTGHTFFRVGEAFPSNQTLFESSHDF